LLQLTGSIPTDIGRLAGNEFYFENRVAPSDIMIWFSNNLLEGTIPTEITLMGDALTALMLANTNMNGTLPEEFFSKCTRLKKIELSDSHFSGTISTSLALLTDLSFFEIANNNFHGTIPEQLSTTNLKRFIVNGNSLSGSIPRAVCINEEPDETKFVVAADCLPSSSTSSEPLMSCACCTLCCDENEVCIPQ
jgi:hypothetical protein